MAVIHGARSAGVAAATGVLGDPAADWLSAAVVAVDLEGGIHRATASEVTHDPTIAAMISFGFGRCYKAQNRDGGEKEQDFFHDGELGYGEFDEARFPLFKPSPNILSAITRFLERLRIQSIAETIANQVEGKQSTREKEAREEEHPR